MKDAPTADINEWGTLTCLAEAADEDGCNAFPSVKTIANYAKISTRTVQRSLAAMVERKLIAEGDQRAALYIPEHRRPTVYDLLIPHEWFRDIERTNSFRTRIGRAPLTRADRPAIAPAPPKKTRADKGKPKPNRDASGGSAGDDQEGRQEVTPVENGPSEGGRQEVTPVENPEKGATTSQGVTTSPERGDLKSEGGRLVVTQPTPSTRTTDSPLPSVGSNGSTAPAEREGGTDGQPIDTPTQKRQARAVERTPGVDLLLGLGHKRPELLLTGKVLQDQARVVDGLLLEEWPQDLILTALLRPLPEQTRSVGAVISRRLRDLSSTPLPRHIPMPAPRDPEAGEGYWERYAAAKRDASTPMPRRYDDGDIDAFIHRHRWADCTDCRNPIFTPTGTDLCPECAGWPKCPLCHKFVQPGTHCERCEVAPEAVEFEVCDQHGDRFIKGTACFQCVAP
ncbi:helix-turn-helix domain-containing protein [Streptomyces sp. NPDC000880]